MTAARTHFELKQGALRGVAGAVHQAAPAARAPARVISKADKKCAGFRLVETGQNSAQQAKLSQRDCDVVFGNESIFGLTGIARDGTKPTKARKTRARAA